MAACRTAVLLLFLYTASQPSTLPPKEVVFSLRVQHEHALHSTLPALYPDTLVEFWMRLIGPVSFAILAAGAAKGAAKGADATADATAKQHMWKLAQDVLKVSAVDAALVLCTVLVFQQPLSHYSSTLFSLDLPSAKQSSWAIIAWLLALSAGHLCNSLLCVTCYKHFINATTHRQAAFRTNDLETTESSVGAALDPATQVQITLALGVQSGLHALMACAHLVHVLHIGSDCTRGHVESFYTNREQQCETFTVLAIVALVLCLLVALPIMLESASSWPGAHGRGSNDAHYLYTQFMCYPTVIGLYCVDRRSTGPTRLIAFCSIVASGVLAFTMASSIAAFFYIGTTTLSDKQRPALTANGSAPANGVAMTQGFQIYKASTVVYRNRGATLKLMKHI